MRCVVLRSEKMRYVSRYTLRDVVVRGFSEQDINSTKELLFEVSSGIAELKDIRKKNRINRQKDIRLGLTAVVAWCKDPTSDNNSRFLSRLCDYSLEAHRGASAYSRLNSRKLGLFNLNTKQCHATGWAFKFVLRYRNAQASVRCQCITQAFGIFFGSWLAKKETVV